MFRWLGRRVHQSLERLRYFEHAFMLLVAVVVGLLCGLGAIALHHLIHWGQLLFWGDAAANLLAQPTWRLALIPILGGLAVGPMIRFLAPEAGGHGVPEVIRAVAERNGFMRKRIVLAKSLASALTISSGGSAGREGPIIQIGAAIASAVGQFLRMPPRQLRVLAGCGAAAGIAATFNAPIAGTLFAVEVILGEFGILQFSPIVIAAVTATVVARGAWGNEPVFHAPAYELASGYELLLYALLGLLCGFVSAWFKRLMIRMETAFENWKRVPAMWKPAIGGLMVGGIGVWLPAVYADGYGSVNAALVDQLPWYLLALLLVFKMAATSFTLCSGGSGGVFAPSLFIGAMAGGLVGHLAHLLPGGIPTGNPGGYALVGMGGLIAGAMHAPITAMIMIFELTGTYTIILPLMTVCSLSTLISSRLQRESIYTWKLAQLGVDLFRGRSLDVFRRREIRSTMKADPPRIAPETPASAVLDQLLAGEHEILYVTSPSGAFTGTIHLADLKSVLLKRDALRHGVLALDLANEQSPVCTPDQDLREAMALFGRTGLPELPVVDARETRRLVGALRYRDVVGVYNEEIIRRDTADVLAQHLQEQPAGQPAPLLEGFSLLEWRPPPAFWNRSLGDAALPARHQVQVVLIKEGAADESAAKLAPRIPRRDYVIQPHDALILCGRDEDLKRLPIH
jgi:CIC family chloride channel protein